MKSKERHRLESNALAAHLNVAIEKYRPYISTIAGVLIAIVVVMFVWSRVSGGSAERQDKAWDAFNSVVGSPIVGSRVLADQSLTQLNQAAEEYAGTPMQPWASVSWADGQVYIATWDVLQDRDAAMSALERAASKYESVISTTKDEELVNRARLGLARIYELRNEPDRAREAYLSVEGSFAELSKKRAEALADAKVRKTLDWLAVAKLTRSAGATSPSAGLGTDSLLFPGATGGVDPAKLDINIDELFKGIDLKLDAATGETSDRYGPGAEAAGGAIPAMPADRPATGDEQPATPTTPTTGDDKNRTDGGTAAPGEGTPDNSPTRGDGAADQKEK